MKLLPRVFVAIFGGMPFTPNPHDSIALEGAREINRELLTISMSDISDDLIAEARAARGHVLAIIHALAPLPDHASRPLVERPIEDYDLAVLIREPAAGDLTDPALDRLHRDDPRRN